MKAKMSNFQKYLHADVRNKPLKYDYIGTQTKFINPNTNITAYKHKKSPAFQAPDFFPTVCPSRRLCEHSVPSTALLLISNDYLFLRL